MVTQLITRRRAAWDGGTSLPPPFPSPGSSHLPISQMPLVSHDGWAGLRPLLLGFSGSNWETLGPYRTPSLFSLLIKMPCNMFLLENGARHPFPISCLKSALLDLILHTLSSTFFPVFQSPALFLGKPPFCNPSMSLPHHWKPAPACSGKVVTSPSCTIPFITALTPPAAPSCLGCHH